MQLNGILSSLFAQITTAYDDTVRNNLCTAFCGSVSFV